MSAYTDDDVRAARAVALLFGVYSGRDTIFEAILDAVAPAIAARALREAADAMQDGDEKCGVKRSCHYADSITLRMRADGIEAGS